MHKSSNKHLGPRLFKLVQASGECLIPIISPRSLSFSTQSRDMLSFTKLKKSCFLVVTRSSQDWGCPHFSHRCYHCYYPSNQRISLTSSNHKSDHHVPLFLLLESPSLLFRRLDHLDLIFFHMTWSFYHHVCVDENQNFTAPSSHDFGRPDPPCFSAPDDDHLTLLRACRGGGAWLVLHQLHHTFSEIGRTGETETDQTYPKTVGLHQL